MQQHIPQEEIRCTIINDMVKKRNSIVPVIGEDTIVYSLGVPFVLLWLFYGALKWFHSALEEGLKVIRRYALQTDKSALVHEAGLIAPPKIVSKRL